MVAIDAPPDEVYDELEGLREQLNSDHTYVPEERSEALPIALVYVDTSEPMGHLSTLMEGDNLQIVSLVSRLHLLEEQLWVGKRFSHFRH